MPQELSGPRPAPGQAADLDAMPCLNTTIDHPQLADLYVLPPIRYPDGRTYLKVGADTMIGHWLPDPAAVRAWYDRGSDDGPLPAFRVTLPGLLPGVRVRAWHTRRCADACTPAAAAALTSSNLAASSLRWAATAS